MMSKTWFKKLTERVFLPVLCVVLLLTPLIVVTSLVALVSLIDVSGLIAWKP